jgi:hypothetical protein
MISWRGVMLLAAVLCVAARAEDALQTNEKSAASLSMSFMLAAEVYRSTDRDRDGIREYPQLIDGRNLPPAQPLDVEKLPKPTAEEAKTIAALIEGVSDASADVAAKATAELRKFEAKAYEPLKAAAEGAEDPDAGKRYQLIFAELEALLLKVPNIDAKTRLLAIKLEQKDLDSEFAEAECFPGQDTAKLKPKSGYFFRVLTRQGKDATGGEPRNCIVNKNMTLGFGLLAFPGEYGVTGKKCFMVSNFNALWERDFGDKAATEAFAKDCVEFNPDKGWTKVEHKD